MKCGRAQRQFPKAPAGRRNLAEPASLWFRETPDRWNPTPSQVPQQEVRRRGSRSSKGYPYSFRELTGDALVNFSGKAGPFVFGDPVEVKHVLLAPIAHHFEARKDDHVIDVTDSVKCVQISLEINHGRGAVRELHIDEHDLDLVRLELVYTGLECRRKIVDPNPTHGIGGAGFPDHQNWIFGYDIGGEPFQHLLGGLARDPPIDDSD